MSVIESSDKTQVTYTEPPGTRWTTPAETHLCDFHLDKGRMVSGDNIITSGYGYGAGPGTGAEIVYAFSGQNSVSVSFLCHAQGQIAEIYLDDKKLVTVDTEAPGPIEYAGLVGQMREVPVATGLSAGVHTLRIRNTGQWSFTPTMIFNTNAKDTNTSELPAYDAWRGRGSQLAVDFIRTGDYAFGTIQGTLKDPAGTPLKHVRLTLDSDVGPLKDDQGRTLFYTDGKGFYSLSGLRAGTYTLTAKQGTVIDTTATVTVAAGATLTHDIVYGSALTIVRPRLMAPTIVARGAVLEVETLAAADASGWTLTLKNDYKTIALTPRAEYGPQQVWNHTKPGWKLTATIPAQTPLALWNLVISHDRGTATEVRAVRTIVTHDQSFYLIHVTDSHCVSRYVPANDDVFKLMLEVMDIIDPRFIALTGDFCQMSCTMQAYEEKVYPMLARINVPLFVSRGNHEAPVAESLEFDDWFWETMVGMLAYNARLGPVNVFCQDVMTASSKTWIEGAYAASQADSADKIRLLLEHCEDYPGSFSPTAKPLPTAMLYGHRHRDALSFASGYSKIQTATAQRFFLRLVRIGRDATGQWARGSLGVGPKQSSLRVATALDAPQLTRTYAGANDGTAIANRAIFVNNLDETFEHGCARFILKKGVYAATGGDIVDSYDSDDATKTIVLVQVKLPAKSTVNVSVTPCVQSLPSQGAR